MAVGADILVSIHLKNNMNMKSLMGSDISVGHVQPHFQHPNVCRTDFKARSELYADLPSPRFVLRETFGCLLHESEGVIPSSAC